MNHADFLPLDFSTPCSISPTDIGAFQRLEGCQRFLRLRLHTANGHSDWLQQQGLQKQTIPPLLTSSGAEFEKEVEAVLDGRASLKRISANGSANTISTANASKATANQRLLEEVRALRPGQTVTLSQPALEVAIGDWRLRGVLDLLRLSRDENGDLHILIADIKASRRAKVEHRLQLAFYYRMIEAFFEEAKIAVASLGFGVLYQGPQDINEAKPEEQSALAKHREQADAVWRLADKYFEQCDDIQTYLSSIDRLVFKSDSLVRDIAKRDFEAVPFHLEAKCDACVFSEFCLRDAATRHDLSLIPYLTATEKSALLAGGIADINELAALKTPRATPAAADDPSAWNELATLPNHTAQVAKLAGNRQVGARLDELIHRAHAFLKSPGRKSYIPSRGEGTLPYVTPEINANIVRIYLDGGLDYVHNRAYLLGARFVSYQNDEIVTSRNVTTMTSAPPKDAIIEAALIREFFERSLEVAVEMAVATKYIDEKTGEIQFKAPAHITFSMHVRSKSGWKLWDVISRR